VASVHKAGQKITYRFVVRNDGNLKMKYLNVDATFSGSRARPRLVYPTRALAPGAKTTVTATYKVTKADIAAAKPILSASRATVRRSRATGTATRSNKSTARVTVR
jgi:hypothetical protein